MHRLARPLMYAGVLGVVLGTSKYHAANIGDYDFTSSSRFAWALAYVALLSLAGYAVGLPEVPRTVASRLPICVVAPAIGAASISLVQLFVGDALLPRFVVFSSALLLVPWAFVMSSLAGRGRSNLEQRDRVLVVGSDDLAAEMAAELEEGPERPATVVRHLGVSAAAGSGDDRPLVAAVAESAASVLVLDSAAQADDRIVDQAASLHVGGIRVRTQSLFYEEWLGKIPVRDLGRVSLFFDIGEIHRDRYGRVKRLIDIVAGVVGLLVLVPVTPVVVGANMVANRGPLLYRQDRVGRNGLTFRMYKFRSMVDDKSTSTVWTAERDPRVTSFGRILRRTHLDELPQAWNILHGDLSVVGPRPEQPAYVAQLVEQLPYYDLRHIVRPGLTGWAQVKYGYAGDERDALQKLQYDFHYLRRQGLLFDLRIVGRTLRAVAGIQGGGR